MTAAELAVTTGGRYHRTRYGGERSLCGQPVNSPIDRRPLADVPDADRCRRCWNQPQGARLERSSMAARIGVRALADGGVCDLCGDPILKEQRIYPPSSDRAWVHAGCWQRGHE